MPLRRFAFKIYEYFSEECRFRDEVEVRNKVDKFEQVHLTSQVYYERIPLSKFKIVCDRISIFLVEL